MVDGDMRTQRYFSIELTRNAHIDEIGLMHTFINFQTELYGRENTNPTKVSTSYIVTL